MTYLLRYDCEILIILLALNVLSLSKLFNMLRVNICNLYMTVTLNSFVVFLVDADCLWELVLLCEIVGVCWYLLLLFYCLMLLVALRHVM